MVSMGAASPRESAEATAHGLQVADTSSSHARNPVSAAPTSATTHHDLGRHSRDLRVARHGARAPKFRAPGVDLRTGVAIGRLVFRALNTAEIVFAAALLTCVFTAAPDGALTAVAAGTAILLLVQVFAVRPRLTRRANRTLAGADAPRPGSHHLYVALEAGKVIALLSTGILLLAEQWR
jgi:hypothetical protein